MYGLNIDPNNSKGNPDPAELRELGVEMVRYTFYDSSGGDQIDPAKANFYSQRARAYHEAGIASLVILTYDTFPNRPGPDGSDGDWDRYIERFSRRAGQIAQLLAPWRPAYQVWNEPDHPPAGGYVPTLGEAVFGRMLRQTCNAIKAVEPAALVLTAGLATGDPGWLTRVINSLGGDLPADIVAFHPYGQRPEPSWPRDNWGFGYVGSLLNGYYAAGQRKPIWITEMGVKQNEVDSPDQAAEFLSRYYNTITNRFSDKVQQVLWFCYSDGMVPPFGLIDINGNRKPIYHSFKRAAAAHPRQPEPVAPPIRPEPTLATPPPPGIATPPLPSPPVTPLPVTEIREEPVSAPAEVAQLSAQVGALQSQVQQIQSHLAQFQSQLQELFNRQTDLQGQMQQLKGQPVVSPGPIPVAPPLTPPAPVSRPAPAIQNIGQLLKRSSTQQFGSRPVNQIQRLIIHHTAIPANIGADRIASYGVDKLGWAGFRYHYFITGDAQTQQANELTTLTDHAGPYSPISLGIGFAGDFTTTGPTAAQIDAGARLIVWLLAQLGLTVEAVVGYKELINTQSPGQQWDNGIRWGEQLKQHIRALL